MKYHAAEAGGIGVLIYGIIGNYHPRAGERELEREYQTMAKVLIADDQADVLAALRLLLKGERFEIESASSPAGVLKAVDSQELDVVLIDLNYARDTTSGNEGLDLLTRIRSADPTLPVVVMTAWGSVDLAVEAMRRGARDFIQKPWDNARLLTVLRTQVELGEALRRGQRLEAENLALRDSAANVASNIPRIVAESQAMRTVGRRLAGLACDLLAIDEAACFSQCRRVG